MRSWVLVYNTNARTALWGIQTQKFRKGVADMLRQVPLPRQLTLLIDKVVVRSAVDRCLTMAQWNKEDDFVWARKPKIRVNVGKLGMECTDRSNKSSKVMFKLGDGALIRWTRDIAMAICPVYRPMSFLAGLTLLIELLASVSRI
jgi:hypothetical protein